MNFSRLYKSRLSYFKERVLATRLNVLSHIYRVSRETWQLVNGFECLLPYIILDIKDFFQFISLTNSFTQIYFTLKSISYKMTAMLYFLLFPFVSKNLTNYGRRHSKPFTNCHVSWDTLYLLLFINYHLGLLAKLRNYGSHHSNVIPFGAYLPDDFDLERADENDFIRLLNQQMPEILYMFFQLFSFYVLVPLFAFRFIYKSLFI